MQLKNNNYMAYKNKYGRAIYGIDLYGENGEIWEAGGRCEEEGVWNAMHYDFCGMSPEEILDIAHEAQGGGGGGRTYTVTFKDADGIIITATTYSKGDTLVPPTITKPEDTPTARYTASWTPTPTQKVTKEATYTAKIVCNCLLKVNGDDSWVTSGSTVILANKVAAQYKDPDKYEIEWKSGDTIITDTEFIIDENGLDLTYVPNKVQYTLVFKNENGEEIKSITTEWGEPIPASEIPEVPEKEGYTAIAWAIPSTMPVKGAVLTAQYTINQYRITFRDEYSGDYVVSGDFGSVVTAPEPAEREGYSFRGWIDTPETFPSNNDTIVMSNGWEINQYILTYGVDGEPFTAYTLYFDTEITSEYIPEPEKEGHTFGGWSEIPERMPARNVEVFGEFIINKYAITFDYDNGTELETKEWDYNTIPAPSIETPEKEDEKWIYEFTDWDNEIVAATEDATYTAQYVEKEKVTYSVYINEVQQEDKIAWGETINLNDYVTDEEYLDDEKYTFKWVDESGSTIANPESVEMPVSDFYASGIATPKKHYLTFLNINGGIIVEKEVEYKAPLAPIVENMEGPEEVGKRFVGWSLYPETMPASTTIVTAQYEDIYYNLIFYVGYEPLEGEIEYTEYSGETKYYGDLVNMPEPDEKEGFSFSGWDETIETMPAADKEIYGVFTRNTHDIEFTVEKEGETITLESIIGVKYGAVIKLEDAPEYTPDAGYETDDWTSDYTGTTMPDEDIAFKKVATRKNVNVHIEIDTNFNPDQSEINDTIQIPWGETYDLYEYLISKHGFNPATKVEGFKFYWDDSGSEEINLVQSAGTICPEYREATYELYGNYEEVEILYNVYYGDILETDLDNVDIAKLNSFDYSNEPVKALNGFTFHGDPNWDGETEIMQYYVFYVPTGYTFAAVDGSNIPMPFEKYGEIINTTIDDIEYEFQCYICEGKIQDDEDYSVDLTVTIS